MEPTLLHGPRAATLVRGNGVGERVKAICETALCLSRPKTSAQMPSISQRPTFGVVICIAYQQILITAPSHRLVASGARDSAGGPSLKCKILWRSDGSLRGSE